jgi:quinone-modifying oxidoreductase subunit QmoA
MSPESRKPVLVIGGGIAGLTAAVELADAGCAVILVEKSPTLGGQVARMHQYFPKLCPPACGLEMHLRRIRESDSIIVHTLAEATQIDGSAGDYQATVRIDPRYVSEGCTACGDCVKPCPVKRKDEFNYGLTVTRAAYLPGGIAYPARYVVDRKSCAKGCRACEEACRYGAVKLDDQVEWKRYGVSAIVAATGWQPYDAKRLGNLGFGTCANVVTNVVLERMAASGGPTGGSILRPSDGKPPRTVAFVQCAGSRDENHLPYCSAVCCGASIKQAAYIRALYPETSITVFYIDLRTPGRIEEFQTGIVSAANVKLVKGKVAKVEQNPATGDLLVTAEDSLSGRKETWQFELVVLATGMVPRTQGLPSGFTLDEFGFITSEDGRSGLYGAGCVRRPEDVSACVRNATAAALQAYQCAQRSERHA